MKTLPMTPWLIVLLAFMLIEAKIKPVGGCYWLEIKDNDLYLVWDEESVFFDDGKKDRQARCFDMVHVDAIKINSKCYGDATTHPDEYGTKHTLENVFETVKLGPGYSMGQEVEIALYGGADCNGLVHDTLLTIDEKSGMVRARDARGTAPRVSHVRPSRASRLIVHTHGNPSLRIRTGRGAFVDTRGRHVRRGVVDSRVEIP